MFLAQSSGPAGSRFMQLLHTPPAQGEPAEALPHPLLQPLQPLHFRLQLGGRLPVLPSLLRCGLFLPGTQLLALLQLRLERLHLLPPLGHLQLLPFPLSCRCLPQTLELQSQANNI